MANILFVAPVHGTASLIDAAEILGLLQTGQQVKR
jgi:hypothetical protein